MELALQVVGAFFVPKSAINFPDRGFLVNPIQNHDRIVRN